MSDTSEAYVRPDVRAFLDFLNALPGPKGHEAGLSEARAMLLKSRHVADVPVAPLAVIRDLACPGPAGEIPLRLYDSREARGPGPLLLFFHGGGFVLGDLDTHEPFCAGVAAQLDLPVIAVDYRLAPEHPFPAGIEDCIAVARWAAESPAALGRAVTGLVPCGDSAGGNFAIVVSLALRDSPAAVPVIAQWPIYPAADPAKGYPSFRDFAEGYLLTREGMDWFDRCYRPDKEDWRYAPMLRSQEGMPPTVLVTASLDPIRDQGRAYAAALAQAGVPIVFREARGNIHGFISLRKAIPSSEEDVRAAIEALRLIIEEAQAK
ncbi:alpha/beta hydrolase [Sphingomonas parva]|uniref:Alpha/beta hydrolase n=1 Tax=Sphingomonas parva TaxID=2555898 RepID=A0A4Y8ZTA8_9SPHN|nr:alpha/beta hydrolase [Sphingomonas parva]TFI59253.1 alpha/beta hydrolase [Sphingomonas parva]